MNVSSLYIAKIAKVFDGDTVMAHVKLGSAPEDLGTEVILENKRIRLNRVDAPKRNSSDDQEKRRSRECHDYVRECLKSVDYTVYMKTYSHNGKIKADIWLTEESISNGWDSTLNKMILDHGLAKEYNGSSS